MRLYYLFTIVLICFSINSSYAGKCFITISPCFSGPMDLDTLPPGSTLESQPMEGSFNETTGSYSDYVADCNNANFNIEDLIPGYVLDSTFACAYDWFTFTYPDQNMTVTDTVIVLLKARCIAAVDDTVVALMDSSSVSVYPTMNDVVVGFSLPSCGLIVEFEPTPNGTIDTLPNCEGFIYLPNQGFTEPDTLNYTVCIANMPLFCSDAMILVNVRSVIPTLGEWGLILLGGLMLAFAMRKLV